jgi:CTP synthase
MTRYIFITGGVVSSLGKGLAMASLGYLLQSRGFKIRLRKLDPYLNVDPGTMSPIQHGEVFVTEDGAETDLDLGHYERFTGIDAKKGDNITTGKIYSTLLKKERKGDYLGGTVQVIPHVTSLIKNFILQDSEGYDFILCEIGGTVGDIEALPFFEAIRQIGYELGKEYVSYVHLTLLPYLSATKELKTKPTQHSVKELRSIGIQPNILVCRAEREIPENEIKKIALFCSLPEKAVIPAIDAKNIYEVPIALHNNGLDTQILEFFNIKSKKEVNLDVWQNILDKSEKAKQEIKICIVGKYIKLSDAYKSLIESLEHACIENKVKLSIQWVNSRVINNSNVAETLKDTDGVIVPGGFGTDGIEGKISAIEYVRKNNIPFLGICLGMQLSIIEIARNKCGLKEASSTEFGDCEHNVVGLMTEWKDGNKTILRSEQSDLGGTMRLGSYECKLTKGTKAFDAYKSEIIHERHRHRYEVNINYKSTFEKEGVIFSGMSPDGNLPEIMEIKNHPWFVAVQFHPELKSRPFAPHPLFCSFIKAAIDNKEKINAA